MEGSLGRVCCGQLWAAGLLEIWYFVFRFYQGVMRGRERGSGVGRVSPPACIGGSFGTRGSGRGGDRAEGQ